MWISWPKQTSGVATGLNENRIRAVGLATGLRFVVRLAGRR